ncbi:MAG: energy transducer TonB [Bacteroidota bacterium]
MMRNSVKVIAEKPVLPDESVKPDFKAVLDQHADYQLLISKYIVAGKYSALIIAIFTGLYFSFIEEVPHTTVSEITTNNDMYPKASPISFDLIPIDTSLFTSVQKNRTEVRLSIASTSEKDEASKPTDILPGEVAKSKWVSPINKNAAPVDGYKNLYAYFTQNVSYTRMTGIDTIQGVVKVRFSIDYDGAVHNLEVVESLSPAFDQEALRLVEQMPSWKPAIKNGIPVSQSLTIPIRFEKAKK